MKKIFLFLIFSLLMHNIYAQSETGYNPANPADPDVFYTMKLETSPREGGTIPFYSTKLLAGQTIRISASPRLGYEFKRWMVGDSVLATSAAFEYVMPESDVVLIAYFEWNPTYNPQNPADPDAEGYSHRVHVYASPSVGGSFNSSSFTLVEGHTAQIYAYPRSGYRFESWLCEGRMVSTDNPMTIRMGTSDISYTATFTYNPVSPGDPSPNMFDVATGSLVIDNFVPGYLNQAIRQTVGEDSYQQVKSILVTGRMTSSDFGFYNEFANCTLIDLSRTTGYNAVPSYAFEGLEKLSEIFFPSSVETIGDYAFNACTNLKDIYLYVATPPVVSENGLNGLNKTVNVHVPSASVPLYAADDNWSQLTIISLDENEKSITVNIPNATGIYKDMKLELLNIFSGQTYRYLITNKSVYTFYALMKNTTYNVSLKNVNNDVLARIDTLVLEDKDLSVNLTSIKDIQDVTLDVYTPQGEKVNASVAVTWFDSINNYLRQGNSVNDLLVGSTVYYTIKLDKDLAMRYVQPSNLRYTVKDKNNSISYMLSPIKRVTLSGRICEETTNQGIANATVAITQTLNEKYTSTSYAKTDSKGMYQTTVFAAPTILSASAYEYINQSLELVIDTSKNECIANNILLKSVYGATINVGFTYISSVMEGETPDTLYTYDDYTDIVYDIYNLTTQRILPQVRVQYPQLVVLEGAEIGNRLKITGRSKKSAFMPVSVEAVVDSTNPMQIIFPIKEYGCIYATFSKSDNSQNVGLLYDNSGRLIKSADYDNNEIKISGIPDGNYTMVTMGKDRYYNSIYNINRFADARLVENIDYVQNNVAVRSGVISAINNEMVPVFEADKFNYIGNQSSFKVDKISVVAGNYITFCAVVDLLIGNDSTKELFLAFDLPEKSSFVENSVLIGSSAAAYSIEDNRLVIPLPNYQREKIRFCIIPEEQGVYSPSAFTSVNLNGKDMLLAIGTARYEVESLTIEVPSVSITKNIVVRGVAMSGAQVEIYDNNVIIGKLQVPAIGSWSINCELADAYNLTVHPVYAKVKIGQTEVQSETKACLYNVDANEVKTVTMTHYNAYSKRNLDVVFNMRTGEVTPKSYDYYTDAVFTFIVDFINNDTSALSNVTVYAFDYNGIPTELLAHYDPKKDRWVASHVFSHSNAPVNVSVDYVTQTQIHGDAEKLQSDLNEVEIAFNSWKEHFEQLDSALRNNDVELAHSDIYDRLEYLVTQENYDTVEFNSLIRQLLEDAPTYDESDSEIADDAFFEQEIAEFSLLYDSLTTLCVAALTDSLFIDRNMFNSDYSIEPYVFEAENHEYTMSLKFVQYIDENYLSEKGYVPIQMTDSSVVWFFISEDSMMFIDPVRKIELTKIYSDSTNSNIRKSISAIPTSCIDAAQGLIGTLVNGSSIESWRNNVNVLKGVMDMVGCFYELVFNSLTNTKQLDELIKLKKIALKNYRVLLKLIEQSKVIPASYISNLKELEKHYQKFDKAIEELNAFKIRCIERIVGKLPSKLTANVPRLETKMSVLGKISGGIGLILSTYDTYCDVRDAQKELDSWIIMRESLERMLPCENDNAKALEIRDNIIKDYSDLHNNFIRIISADIVGLAADAASIKTWKNPLVTLALFNTSVWLNVYTQLSWHYSIDGKFLNHKSRYWYEMSHLNCNKKNPEPPKPKTKPASINWDPSGYVYEGVSSNRLQGVTATAYYMQTTEDTYGVLHSDPIVWDAEEYAQENPLFTDEYGMYRWDVPQGLWQVKFEKEGYETAYSDWLPVPPPQLDVNIAMTQYKQPEIKSAHAYEDGVVVEFDKYMIPALLNADNIFISQNGKYVQGSIEMLNEEYVSDNNDSKYASRVRFIPNQPFTAREITLFIANRVKSYAGLQMQDNYQQTFDIEQEIKTIVADSLVNVIYGEEQAITVSVLPAEASAGQRLVVKSAYDAIASVPYSTYILDNKGQAQVVVHGELPGSTSVLFSVENTNLNALTTVCVGYAEELRCAPPTASVPSGIVNKGTEVFLFCETADAVIYYTLDGSNPETEKDSRHAYNGTPIIITENITIRAYAVASDKIGSSVVEFTYEIENISSVGNISNIQDKIICYPLPAKDELIISSGEMIMNRVVLTTMTGVVITSHDVSASKVVLDVANIPAGAYVATVITEEGVHSCHIIKTR